MTDIDPYDILGVARDSGPAEWKRAYRRLAMRWHPDRNDHPEATERFKVINAAYELIATVEGKNEPKTENPESEAPAPEPEDSVARAADIRLNLDVSLEEAAAGCRKTIHVTRGKACPTCEGSGEAGMARTHFCDACHGSGRVHDAHRRLIKCDACDGRGLFKERICPDCEGSGRELAEVSLKITVPPGMLPGDELRLAGQGEPGDEELEAGHLYLTLVIRSHPLFQLHGRDLHCRMPVSALAMIAGAEIELPALGGVFRHALEPGAAGPRQLRLAGKGYPGRGRSKAGGLIVELEPVFPQKLNARQRKLLLQANAALMDDAAEALPEIASWRFAHGSD
ncbi:MAG: J domain-containing protein [Rhodocyclaceae bacterium]|jgi:molecular chaperone DnaJ|nr:MAG: J domain-containing protein [Rhodocyclaceae bacterium]